MRDRRIGILARPGYADQYYTFTAEDGYVESSDLGSIERLLEAQDEQEGVEQAVTDRIPFEYGDNA
jgi:hypothetical protein